METPRNVSDHWSAHTSVGADMLETERSDPQPSQAGPYLMGSAQKY
eukprot:COSAG04_NODE_1941_length_5169_cov_7.496450_2_plen_46_part_00